MQQVSQPLIAPRRPPNSGGPAAPRRDPAPSRTSYRFQRLMLSPSFRGLLHVGLPVTALFLAGVVTLSDPDRREAIELKIAEVRRSIEERPEFMVKLMAIDGASDAVAHDIRLGLPMEFPVTTFDLDLEMMRASIGELGAVASVDVEVHNNILQINVVERVPAFVWRSPEGTILLDQSGHRVAPIAARSDRPDLPLIVGGAANEYLAEAIDILAACGPLSGRVRGVVRVSERRWDLVLDRNQRILLPEQNAIAALERVIALDKAQDLLSRDLTVIHMRNGQRPTIRIADNAIEALRQIRMQD